MANVLDRNFDFATNGTVTAEGLHNLIDETNIYAGLTSTQEEKTTVGTSDLLLVADSSSIGSPQVAANRTTVYNLFEDALTGGTYVNAQLSGNLTYGTATGNRTISTGANITNGTISTLIAGTTTSTAATITNGTITTGLIPTLTTGTTTSTAEIVTSGTIATLNSTTGTIATLRSTTGTISNLSTTLAGDLTISQGTATLATSGVTAGTYGGATSIPVLTLDAKGRVTTASTSSVTSGLTGFRNRIINGDMRLDQRSGGTAYAIATSSLYGSCDRWGSLAGATGVWSQQRVTTGSTDFPFAMRVQRTAGSTSTAVAYIGQVIETSNCQDLAGQSVTVSFYATAGANFSASGSVINCNVYGGTGEDQGWAVLNAGSWTSLTSLMTLSQAITTTRTRYSVTATLPSGIKEIAIRFDAIGTGTAGANDWFQITGVQLEVGSTATDFERRPIGTETMLCQRYYYELPSGATNAFVINAGQQTNTNAYGTVYHPTDMRIAPTLGVAGTTTAYYTIVNSTTVACTSLPAISGMSSPRGCAITMGASASAGYASWIAAATSAGKLSFSSEL